ncbi:MAG: tRNA (adenosine(37)-N6)-threonylcarbamoyltransferase complex dimerization subunit type 1 TsaB [Clostridiales bacterium]|nr:tRNA (adenosine(37)-N6)-threonylcarbamoyltransferase complex dimerization subunit type 1 TsaB [Clostridiales bacterium]
MNILAIDTTGKHLTVALKTRGEWKVVFNRQCNLNHSVVINQQIDDIVKQAGISYSDLDVCACNVGVGSFTGIRVGIATIKGLCFASTKKLVSVNTFEILAYNTQEQATVLVPDNRGFYCQHFENGVAVDDALHTEQEPDDKVKIFFDNETDYSQNFVGLVDSKVKKGEFVQNLTPLYVRKSQAEENK